MNDLNCEFSLILNYQYYKKKVLPQIKNWRFLTAFGMTVLFFKYGRRDGGSQKLKEGKQSISANRHLFFINLTPAIVIPNEAKRNEESPDFISD
jgi:hypothetical protein